MIGNLILRLSIWFLLTANLSLANIIIGVAIALLLPQRYANLESLTDWLQILSKIIIAIPQAYLESFEIMLRPHNREEIITEKVPARRTPALIFLDIFLITFTPKTIVLKYQENGYYLVHRVARGKNP